MKQEKIVIYISYRIKYTQTDNTEYEKWPLKRNYKRKKPSYR